MADEKISAFTAAGALTGTELVPIVQSGVTVRTTVADIAAKGSFLKKDGTDIGATSQVQQFNNGISGDVAGFNVRASSTGISISNTTTGVAAEMGTDGTVRAVSNTNSTFSRLNPDGTIDMVTVLNGITGVIKKCFAKVSLTAAQINSGASIPVQLLAAQGAGKIIRVTDTVWNMTFGTVAFDNIIGYIYSDGVADPTSDYQLIIASEIVSANTDTIVYGLPNKTVVESTLVANTAIFFALAGDSAAGDSTVDLYISYDIITL